MLGGDVKEVAEAHVDRGGLEHLPSVLRPVEGTEPKVRLAEGYLADAGVKPVYISVLNGAPPMKYTGAHENDLNGHG